MLNILKNMATNIITYTDELQLEPDFSAKISPNNPYLEFKLRASDVENIISIGRVKDFLYNEAINNLIKKSKFLQLYIQLIEKQITDEEYEQELDLKSDDYFINIKEINSDIDFAALILIMQNLPKNLSLDDVSEIFGIKSQSLVNKLNA